MPERRGRLIKTNGGQGWHRDGGTTQRGDSPENGGGYWGSAPSAESSQEYMPPSVGCNVLLYLQDMTDDTGRLHVCPGSHCGLPADPKADDRWEFEVAGSPRKTVALACKAGDVVVTHDELLHSGGFNTSSSLRAYMSTKVCRLGLPHRDDFSAVAIHELVAAAEQAGDRRALRFYGHVAARPEKEEEAAWARLLEAEAVGRRTQAHAGTGGAVSRGAARL
eukprot:SAG22_NODE_5753_length_959_cov_0.797674_2_plen_221_part_00